MAGGQGAGYTRSPMPAAQSGSAEPTDLAVLRETPCHDDPATCSGCGMCVVRRPWDAEAIAKGGATRIGAGLGTGRVEGGIAGLIDHTLLKPDVTREQVHELCEEARKHHFKTVCVNSGNVRLAAQFLSGSGVGVTAVVGFPLGAMTPTAKAFETREAIRCGAREIDMVINIGALKSNDLALVLSDIKCVVDAARPHPVKVILETSKLDDTEKVIACTLSKAAGAAFVKTSTGFGGGGATVEDVALMRRVVGAEMGVKASGGVRSADDAKAMVEAGANRIGASASVAIVTGGRSDAAY